MGARRTHEKNLATLYAVVADRYPENVAIVSGVTDGFITYREFQTHVEYASHALSEQGIQRGDHIALLMENQPEFLFVFFGAIRVGAVPTPLNVKLPQSGLAPIIADSEAKLLIASASLDEKALAVAEALDTPNDLTVSTEDSVVDDSEANSSGRSGRSLERESEPVDGTDPAFQLYTSGSTGQPKGVVHTHAGGEWMASINRKVQLLDSDDRCLAAGPLYHKNTLAGGVKPTLLAGGSVVLTDGFEAEELLTTIDEYDVTCIRSVPTLFQRLVADEEAVADRDVSSVEWAVAGGAQLSETVVETFEREFEARLAQAYGTTESGSVLLSPRWGPTDPENLGLPLPGVEIRLVDPSEDTRPGEDEVGELLVSSPGLGRYDDSAGKDDSFELVDGKRFFRTGDLARADERGYYHILGRVDDVLLVGGEKVHPSRIERCVEQHQAIDNVAVVGVPHSTKGQAPVAFVVSDTSMTEQAVKQIGLERLSANEHPRRVFFVDELPLAGTGKIDRRALEDEARERIQGPL